MSLRLVGVFAHPDDHSLLCGGTFAHYADRGADITAVSLAGGRDLDSARLKETGRRIGVRQVVIVDYPPGELTAVPVAELDELCLDLLRSLQPRVVITFGPDGLNRDPDRLAVHASTARAFFTWRRDPRSTWAGAKLYYGILPQQHLRRALGALEPGGARARLFPDPARWGAPESAVTTVIDVHAELDRKIAGFMAPFPALEKGVAGVGTDPLADLFGLEFYRRAYPDPWVTGVIERDILKGLAARRLPQPAPLSEPAG